MHTLKINGKDLEVNVDHDTPLLWVVREIAGLTGTKFGCGKGLCGACTVHINGKATRTCITPVGDAINAEITTIEALDPDGQHPVQKAWIVVIEGISVTALYKWDQASAKFVVPAGAKGLSPGRSEIVARNARDWAHAIWADMLS